LNIVKQRRSFFLTVLFLVLLLPAVAAAQQGPGAAFFSYTCGSSSISFYIHGTPILQATFSEIVSPLSQALSTGQNQFIKSAADVALYALKSDELQIHQVKDPDLTKYVLPSTICGPLYVAPIVSGNSAQALAMVQINGNGQGIAYAQVAPNGQVTAFAAVSGSGSALAAAQSSITSGTTSPTNSSEKFHVVIRGENLFRIALHYGTTVAVLSQMNNITDPTRIYVGQKIYLP
jgi:LysM repeat protein